MTPTCAADISSPTSSPWDNRSFRQKATSKRPSKRVRTSLRLIPVWQMRYLYLALFRQIPEETAFQSAHEALRRAQQLDDSIGEVHDTLGTISWRHDWNWDEAEREFDRAIAMAPSYACAHEDRAEFLAFLGRRAEALAEITRINQIELGSSAAMTEADVYYQLRDFPSLVDAAQRGITSDPNEWVEHQNLGIGYIGTGKPWKRSLSFKKPLSYRTAIRMPTPRSPTHTP